MVKADIVERVFERLECKKTEAVVYVESVFEIMKDTLESGEKVKVSGFGVFEVKQKRDRRGRNPQTGETITIEARRVLTFKPSNVLRDAINQESLSP
jgi:integration host factor subunit alpha